MILNESKIKELNGRISTKKKFVEVILTINEDYNISFFIRKLPCSSSDVNMVFIQKGRNQDIAYPIRENKIIHKEKDVELLGVIETISKILFDSQISNFDEWKKNKI